MRLIPVEKARIGMIMGKNIYGANGQVLLRQGIELTESYIQHLYRHGVNSLYIKSGPDDDIVVDDVIREKTRVAAIALTREIAQKVLIGASIDAKKVRAIINNIIDDLLSNPNLVISLVDIRSLNDYTFGHSVNVAVLSGIIGIALGYDQLKLRNLAIGALFHDIGKVKIKQDLIHKPGPLIGEEIAEMQKHAEYGFEILRANKEINLQAAHVAYQHHERYNGSGYPRGIKGDEIIEFARIVSITESYDTLTTDTPYQARHSAQEAIEFLTAGCDVQFDPKFVRVFLNSVAIYPVGVEVELNTGERGIVVEVHKNFPTRPVVRIIRNQFGTEITGGYDVDLLSRTTYFITYVMDEFIKEPEEMRNQDGA